MQVPIAGVHANHLETNLCCHQFQEKLEELPPWARLQDLGMNL